MRADEELFGDPLPTYLTRFVGRAQELSELTALVGSARMVTVCGTGGSGKSRLSVEFARRLSRDPVRGGFRDGLVWVPLVAVSEPEFLPRSLAAALGLPEAAGGRATRELQKSLEELRLLLVLDNCEQVADGCAELLDELLPACPHLSVLATSRRPLVCQAEVVFGLSSLDQDKREQSDAVALFIDRGAITSPLRELAEPDSEVIRDICERLDGLPLAIELVASWVGVLSPRGLSETLGPVAVLGSDTPPVDLRHGSIHSVLDITWGWLAADDRRVLRDLGVFPGAVDRAAAQAVAGASLASLSVLTGRSLIQRMPDSAGESRYHMHDLVRGYAVERLTALGAESVDELQARHFDYFLGVVERASAAWDTDDEQRALSALAADQANVDLAMGWATETGQADRALAMSAGLASLWIATAPLGRSAALLTRALDLPWEPLSQNAIEARCRALDVAGRIALATGDLDLADLRFGEALTLSEQIADSGSIARSLRGIGAVRCRSGDAAAGEPYVRGSLALCRETGDERGIAWSRYHLGEIALARGRLDTALVLLQEAVASFENLGIGCGVYRAQAQLGELHSRRDELESALASFGHAVGIQIRRHFVALGAAILEGVAGVAARMRRLELAATLVGAGDSWRDAFGPPRMTELPNDPPARRAALRQLGPDAFGEAYEDGRRLTSAQSQALLDSAIGELSTGLSISAPPAGLTGREVEVLRLVALGLSNGEIAAQLVVSPRTVHAHLRSIFTKLGVTTRTAAVHEAARIGVT